MGSETPEGRFRPALLVVDFQEDFCPPHGALAVPHGRDIAPLVNELLSLPFILKVATRDWHPPNHISFASNHPSATPFLSMHTIYAPADCPSLLPSSAAAPASDTTRLWPVHCVAGTPGASLAPEMHADKIDLVLDKGQDARVEMYSAFCDPFGVSDSGLERRLREEGVTDVFVVGLALDYCVKRTAEDAVERGWRTWVVRGATRAIDEEGRERTEEKLRERGVGVVDIGGGEVERVRALARGV